jgi:hypothetical protein
MKKPSAQVLKLTKGWDVARDHALTAVRTDNRMRSWSHDGRTGLLYKCGLGSVDLNAPIGARTLASSCSPPTTCCSYCKSIGACNLLQLGLLPWKDKMHRSRQSAAAWASTLERQNASQHAICCSLGFYPGKTVPDFRNAIFLSASEQQ